jgi:transcriptional regulator with XRE-family HTH domain
MTIDARLRGNKELGERIYDLRRMLGWTKGKVAEEVGVHPETIKRWERGESRPTYKHVVCLAEAFDQTYHYITMGVFKRYPPARYRKTCPRANVCGVRPHAARVTRRMVEIPTA